ncbi:HNH endonuclease [Rhizobium sp. J15]|uniref:HNH endonuclease n=1 Tax=Rhizobium sp. J15 TaxID=2035450 RepID=UPI000BEA158B|nr:HNH endonuclease [Rhizobium sp. J15]PDT14320.1 HNH endonuclease [Rhizobium sp. J15]
MPVNPKWTREETLLALDLLYQYNIRLGREHKEVIALSELLQKAPIHPPETRRNNFREPHGVAKKIDNLLLAVESNHGYGVSNADKAAVSDYPRSRKEELAALANSLRASFILRDGAEELPDDEVFVEGKWLTVRHRKRDQRLRQRLLTKLRGKELQCEMCSVSPPPIDRELQESRYEAHHRIPLAEAEHESETRVADMALLCACCHRTLHKMISRFRRWVSVAEGRSLLGLAPL